MTASVVQAGSADIGMPQPDLDLGNIGVILQDIGRRRGAQAVHPEPVDLDARGVGPLRDHLIDAVRGGAAAGGAAPQRAEQWIIARLALAVPLQVGMQAFGGHRVQR